MALDLTALTAQVEATVGIEQSTIAFIAGLNVMLDDLKTQLADCEAAAPAIDALKVMLADSAANLGVAIGANAPV